MAGLSNLDKHRTIPPVFALMGAQEITVKAHQPELLASIEVQWAPDMTPLHDGAELCRVLTHPDPNITVDVEGKSNFPIAFGAPPRMTVSDIGYMIEFARDIVRRFPGL